MPDPRPIYQHMDVLRDVVEAIMGDRDELRRALVDIRNETEALAPRIHEIRRRASLAVAESERSERDRAKLLR